MHVTHLLLIFTEPLSPPYSLQEAKVSLMNSTICNTFYGQTPGEGRNYSVQEEMLCVGDFSTGKAICQVSKVGLCCSLACSAGLSFPWGACVGLNCLGGDPRLPASFLLHIFRGLHSSSVFLQTSTFLRPPQHKAVCCEDPQTVSILVACFKL